MKKNTIIRVVLLAFVATAIVYMFLRDRPATSGQAATKTTSGQAAPKTATAPESAGFVVYYFHGTRRCPTCRTIEAQAQEAITTRFADELRQGRLRWAAVNLEEIGNDHYATDYGVAGSALVIAQLSGGRPVRSSKLEEVWRLVHNKPAFINYVAAEVTAFLKAKP
jgi:hypothetical protein